MTKTVGLLNQSETENAAYRSKIIEAENRFSGLKKRVKDWQNKIAKASQEKFKNLTTTEGLLNQSETENAAYRSKIIKAENRLSALKKNVKAMQNNHVKIS